MRCAAGCRRAAGRRCSSARCSATGLIDRLKLQTLDLRNRIAPILADGTAALGPRPRRHVQSVQGDSVQLGSRASCRATSCIGASDFPSLWNQKPREGMHLHWDGDNDSVDERNLSAALGAGVTPVTVDHDSLKRVRDWIWTLPPPKYPYPVDQALAVARARRSTSSTASTATPTIASATASMSGARVGQVGADRSRSAPIGIGSIRTPLMFAANQYGLYPESPYRFTHFRKTNGYANHPLDGIWLRGPYLHNGSVPTLRDLLDRPEQRPAVFYRGYDVFDQVKVGFVSNVPAADGQVVHAATTRPCRATAMAGTSTARRCPTRRSGRSSST